MPWIFSLWVCFVSCLQLLSQHCAYHQDHIWWCTVVVVVGHVIPWMEPKAFHRPGHILAPGFVFFISSENRNFLLGR